MRRPVLYNSRRKANLDRDVLISRPIHKTEITLTPDPRASLYTGLGFRRAQLRYSRSRTPNHDYGVIATIAQHETIIISFGCH
jgi:hypothetical protein